MTEYLRDDIRRLIDEATKTFADEGRLIAAGWAAFRLTVVSPDAPQEQLDEMRLAYFAGSQHLYASIMSMLDPGEDPSAGDTSRMELIDKELNEFATTLASRAIKPKGRA